MNKHLINKVLGIIVVIIALISYFVFNVSPLIFAPILISILLVFIYGILNLDFNYFYISICKANITEKKIALSFDDGPCLESLELMKTLNKNHVKATFFCIGSKIKQNANIIKELDKHGHLIGNHSYYHSNSFNFQSSEKVIGELEKTNELILEVIGKKPTIFRPPYGVSNPMIGAAIKKLNLYSIAWNIRTFDTFFKNEKIIFDRIINKLEPGSIVLMHDTLSKTSSLAQKLINYCKEHDYKIVPLNELLNMNCYE